MATMTAHLDSLDLSYERIRAVDANDLSGAEGVHKPPYMDLGARACLLSHGEALKSFQETGQPAALILEDDVELARDLPQLCESVEWWIDKTPLVKLDIAREGRAKLMGAVVGEAPGGRAMRPIIRWTAGAGAYLVARSISGEVLDAYEKADMPVDHILFDHRISELPRRFRPVLLDPAASSFAMLMRNIELNQMSDRVSAYCLALSAETKLDMLNMWDTDPGGWMNSFGIETNQFGESIPVSFRQPTMGFSIDDFVRTFDPPLPSHFKMDVDGLEAMILRGGRETLSSPMVRSAIVEIEGDLASEHNREILAVMDGLGFEARPKASPKLRNVVFDRSSGKRT